MIGYIQDTELLTILNEVNSISMSTSLPELLLSPKGWKSDVSKLDHRLDRLNFEPTPFDLRHLWVDLRHHYEHQSTASREEASGQKKRTSKKTKFSSKSQ